MPFFIYYLLETNTQHAFYVFLLAGLTDVLDGTAARVFHQRSKLGSLLDPLADKLLMASAYILLGVPSLNVQNPLPIWLIITVVGRDLAIALCAFFLNRFKGIQHFQPSTLGKASTVAQVVVIAIVLFFNILEKTPSFLTWLYWVTLCLTLASSIKYALLWFPYLLENKDIRP